MTAMKARKGSQKPTKSEMEQKLQAAIAQAAAERLAVVRRG